MASGPDWSKRSVVATWTVGAVATVLWIIQYFRPPDPSHPMSFDFLSRSIAIPPWLAAITLLLVIMATTAIVRRRFSSLGAAPLIADNQETISEQKREIERLKSQLTAELQAKANRKPEYGAAVGGGVGRGTPLAPNPFLWDLERKQLLFKWPEGLSVEVAWHETGTYGLVLYVINDLPDYMASYKVEVTDSQSWSEKHKTFLPNRAFTRRVITQGKNLDPIHKTNAEWLVRVLLQKEGDRLAVGNDSQNQLSWPNNDPTKVEIWRLTLAVSYDRLLNLHGNPTGLSPANLLVRWDRENLTIAMMKEE